MKKLLFVIMAAVAVMSVSLSAFAKEDKPAGKVIVYYFHGAFRCATCTKMEKYSKEAIETNFKDALVSGKLEFKAVNVEERGNEHFVQDYQLYTKALVISLVESGKEIKSKNLTKIWEYVNNKQKFFEYITREINGFLKGS